MILENPGRLPRELRYESNYYGRRINNLYYRIQGPPDGYDLVEADWDTAIILDACRYDYFADHHPFTDGSLKKATAPGSTSVEFFRRTFDGENHHDIVYVTSNPYLTALPSDTFHATYLEESWNENTTPPPERITDVARQAHTDHPNKRVIVHYMQPHLPIKHPDYEHINDNITYRRSQYWPEGIDTATLRQAYVANLKLVCSHVAEFLPEINGKVIITADHGELLGERQRPLPIQGYNHHAQLYMRELIQVPWVEFPSEQRRDIEKDPPKETLEINQKAIEERLQALGYR